MTTTPKSHYEMADLKQKRNCIRMDSCLVTGDGKMDLVGALEADNLRLFVDILCVDDVDVNGDIAERQHSNILHLAVTAGKIEFAKEILKRRDINPNAPHVALKKFPLQMGRSFSL